MTQQEMDELRDALIKQLLKNGSFSEGRERFAENAERADAGDGVYFTTVNEYGEEKNFCLTLEPM